METRHKEFCTERPEIGSNVTCDVVGGRKALAYFQETWILVLALLPTTVCS